MKTKTSKIILHYFTVYPSGKWSYLNTVKQQQKAYI